MSKKMAWGEEQDREAAGFPFQGEQDLGAEFQFQEDQDALRSILENKGIGRAQVRYPVPPKIVAGSVPLDPFQDYFFPRIVN